MRSQITRRSLQDQQLPSTVRIRGVGISGGETLVGEVRGGFDGCL